MFYGGAALDRWPAQQLWAACTSPAVPVCVLAWSASFGSRLTELLLHAMWRPCGKGVKAVLRMPRELFRTRWGARGVWVGSNRSR